MELMMNNQAEIDFLMKHIKSDSVVLEWGSGGSTIAISKIAKIFVSIEHDIDWYENVITCLKFNFESYQSGSYMGMRTDFFTTGSLRNFKNHCKYHYVPRNKEEAAGDDGTIKDYFDYVNIAKNYNKIFDVIFIDGRARVECAKVAVQLLKPGGVIIIHDYRNPVEKYRRYEYEVVEEFLTHTGGEYALHSFIPKETIQEEPLKLMAWRNIDISLLNNSAMNIEKAKTMGWYDPKVCEAMNAFYEKEVKPFDLSNHGHVAVFVKLLNQIDKSAGVNLVDIGTGVGWINDYCKGFEFTGSDLAWVLQGCAMNYFPNLFYKACDVLTDDVCWIERYDVVVANGFIDVQPDALQVLKKLLPHVKGYFLLHRQEITEQGITSEIENGNYVGQTVHSIINRAELLHLLDQMNFEIIAEEACPFANWENGGSSFLFRKRKSWALNKMDHYLNSKYFAGVTNGSYLEAGANDGLRQSNTMYFEQYKNWSGILIEPMLSQYHQCRANRGPVNIVVYGALVAEDYSKEVVDMIYTPECHGLMSVVDNENAPELLKRVGNEPTEKCQVPALSLNTILQKIWHRDNWIDLMVLDVEGHEKDALKGMDFKIWGVNYLLIEQLNGLDPEIAIALEPFFELLEVVGEHDYLFKRRL